MDLFPVTAPPLKVIGDYAKLFTKADEEKIARTIHTSRKKFPQIHWRVVTIDLPDSEDLGLFAFWLLNVSPLDVDEEIQHRRWTILLVILPSGEIAVAPGYSAEVWLSGHDWSRLMTIFHRRVQKKGYSEGVGALLNAAEKMFFSSWQQMREKLGRKRRTDDEDL